MPIGKSCSRQHTARQPRRNSGTRQCGRNGICSTRSARPSSVARARKLLLDRRPPCASATSPTSSPARLSRCHGLEQRERSLAFAELAVDAEIGAVGRELAPQQVGELGILRDFASQRRKIERRPFRREQMLRHARRRRRRQCGRARRRARSRVRRPCRPRSRPRRTAARDRRAARTADGATAARHRCRPCASTCGTPVICAAR